eukprot:CAMPEP_0172520218 /NCGR_PEP_ID=MMETSP1066-20121228/291876_1 /TAXON_ID=671091 /ORGANISM="Coscinodiscus wailesii, Strain CCMP2513" /LENGTH=130 /DNA_ID=CAMNT_0013302939 /DNA_START=356 /DNA_END=745 /DNA_ORIENTATION=-
MTQTMRQLRFSTLLIATCLATVINSSTAKSPKLTFTTISRGGDSGNNNNNNNSPSPPPPHHHDQQHNDDYYYDRRDYRSHETSANAGRDNVSHNAAVAEQRRDYPYDEQMQRRPVVDATPQQQQQQQGPP